MTDEKTAKRSLTYADSGVDYDVLDPFKRAAQQAAAATSRTLWKRGVSEVEWSRGESAYLQFLGDGRFMAHVEEGLGSKNLIADAMQDASGTCYYDHIAQDTVAMIVNDMITLGALPNSVAMHLAVGSNSWFHDETRVLKLIEGWQHSCQSAGCAWGGGETPTLKGLVARNRAVISGSAVGLTAEQHLIRGKIADGDAIILLHGSGIHANGLTLAREIAGLLPQGYLTLLPDGRTYGEALLDPTPIYVPAIEALQRIGVDIHYAVNITGHGWRKLMRLPKPFTYRIECLPKPQPIFEFIARHGNIDEREMFGNFNMGAGFAVYVAQKDMPRTICAIRDAGLSAFWAGRIVKSDERQVVIAQKNLIFSGDTLTVR